jgi:hypothetical protein
VGYTRIETVGEGGFRVRPGNCEPRFKPYPHGATSQKTIFFIVIAVKTSNITYVILFPKLLVCGFPL